MKKISAFLSLILIFAPFISLHAADEALSWDGKDLGEAREIIVQWRASNRQKLDAMKAEFQRRADQMFGRGTEGSGLTVRDAYDHSFTRVTLPPGEDAQEFIRGLQAMPGVGHVEVNAPVYALSIPNDPYFVKYQWNLKLINMPERWDTSAGEGMTVAVVDSGVAYEDTVLFRKAPEFTNTSFVQGYDFINRDDHPDDDYGHGTHMAGVLAAGLNDNLGIAGVAPGVNIMPLKILNSRGVGTMADLAEAIRWAADHGARVVNMSVGSPERSEVVKQALSYAYGKGVVLIAAAGNEGRGELLYPAAESDYVIAVGAANPDGTRASYSNTGTALDIIAPGGDISLDANGDGYPDGVLSFTFPLRGTYADVRKFVYLFGQGTSVAVPHVAGVAAMVMASGVNDPAVVRTILRQSATDKGLAGWDRESGAGLLNAAKAVELAKNTGSGALVTAGTLTITREGAVGAGFTSAPSEGAEVNPAPTSEPQDENIPTSPSGEDPSQEGTDLIESLQVKLQFVNRFGREATRVPWWDVVAVHVQVVDQSGNAVTGAFVELRYRYAGTTADLGKPTALTDASGAADFKIGPFKMKSTIEAGVVASKDGVNSQLAMGTLSVR